MGEVMVGVSPAEPTIPRESTLAPVGVALLDREQPVVGQAEHRDLGAVDQRGDAALGHEPLEGADRGPCRRAHLRTSTVRAITGLLSDGSPGRAGRTCPRTPV